LIASAANRGQQDIHDTAQKWLVGLGNIEKLLTALRVARGTKKQALKTQQLADSAELFGAIEAFLVSVGLKPAISFRLQVVRSKVLEGCVSQKNISGPVDSAAAKMAKIFKDIAAESAAAATSSGHVDSSLWLRALFQELFLFAEVVPKRNVGDAVAAQAARLRDDLAAVAASLETQCRDCLPVAFLDDLKAVVVLLSLPGGTRQSTASVKTALERCRTADAVTLTTALASQVWAAAVDCGQSLLETSAADSWGDEKMQRALDILRDPRLPQFDAFTGNGDQTQTAAVVVVDRTGYVTSGRLLADLEESLLAAVEAHGLWSPLRAEMETACVRSWAEALEKTIAAVNSVHWMCLMGCFVKAGILDEVGTEELPHFTADLVAYLETAVEEHCGVDIEEHRGGDRGVGKFCTRVATTIEGFAKGWAATADAKSLIGRLRGDHLRSTALRECVFDVVAAWSLVTLPLASPEDLVEEWRVKKGAEGASNGSQIALILNLLRVVSTLRAHHGRPYFPTYFEYKDVFVRLVFEDAALEPLQVSHNAALSLSTLVSNLNEFYVLQENLQYTVGHILTQIHSALSVPLAAVTATQKGPMNDIAALLTSLVDVAQMDTLATLGWELLQATKGDGQLEADCFRRTGLTC